MWRELSAIALASAAAGATTPDVMGSHNQQHQTLLATERADQNVAMSVDAFGGMYQESGNSMEYAVKALDPESDAEQSSQAQSQSQSLLSTESHEHEHEHELHHAMKNCA